jgi:hypothetical protein
LKELGLTPKWQAWMRKTQPRLLVIWGKYDLSFDRSEPEAYRRDVPDAMVHILDAGHFALDTAADEIAGLVRGFVAVHADARRSSHPDSATAAQSAPDAASGRRRREDGTALRPSKD